MTSIEGHPLRKTELMHWAAVGDLDRVRVLLARGEAIDARDTEGDTALRYALTKPSVAMFRLLLDSGADPNAGSTSASGYPGFRILHAVAEAGLWDILEVLIEYGADVDPRGMDGMTPLMLAAGANRDQCARALLTHGADIDATDADGDSVLYYAASKGHVSTTLLLLNSGARANPAPSRSGHTPLTIAAQKASPIGTRSADAPLSKYTRITVALLAAGADATSMYRAGLVLKRVTERGLRTVELEDVQWAANQGGEWTVAYVLPQDRGERETNARHGSSPSGGANSTRAWREHGHVAVQSVGQRGFVNSPTIKVFWNQELIGQVEHGGRYDFEIDSDGEVRFTYLFRAARVQVKASGTTRIELKWDRMWGRLLATVL